jgi:hypothetical protein
MYNSFLRRGSDGRGYRNICKIFRGSEPDLIPNSLACVSMYVSGLNQVPTSQVRYTYIYNCAHLLP